MVSCNPSIYGCFIAVTWLCCQAQFLDFFVGFLVPYEITSENVIIWLSIVNSMIRIGSRILINGNPFLILFGLWVVEKTLKTLITTCLFLLLRFSWLHSHVVIYNRLFQFGQ